MKQLIRMAIVAGAVAWSIRPFPTSRIVDRFETLAQSPASVGDGVYTEGQATRGRSAFLAQSCVRCHGETLAGNEFGPTLVGAEFVGKWSGMSVADLFTLIHETMPQDNPGRLSTQQAADILAYLLKGNGFPAGQTELSRNPSVLKTITIEQKPTPSR